MSTYTHRVQDPDPLLHEIAAFLGRQRMGETTFGTRAVKDPNLVEDLRCGREPRRRTAARIRDFIASHAK